ncbi:MAG: sulfurtransferase, partial [Chloroflexi bacterium]|nr:sulfurtransferase [Chloroflexota bacterium]
IDCSFSLAKPELGRKNYLERHIPGAFYAHLGEDLSGPIIAGKTSRHPLPPIEDFVEKLSNWGIDKESQVIVYDDAGGMVAGRLWWMIQWLGHENVALLNGGIQEWEKKYFPTNDQLPNFSREEFNPNVQRNRLVEVEELEKLRESPHHLLVDSRASERYSGKEENLDHTAGHIPGAVNLHFQGNLDENGLFLNKELLKKRFSEIHKELAIENTIYYCGSGVSANHNLIAIKYAGFGNAKLYAGSWSEWITDEKRPIATEE